ncbi:hypothetical protein CIK65_18820 [Brevibacterium aurantiacum]|uniref:ABC transporter domain-containing protein n=2 Tax=Brevibacterium aurantiacum TaxID=273384 RepID=A0A2A3YPJ5_BREAU|nr:hypothetical protein CIK65_18820 [Brevibacterium aurantiacum]
MSPHVPPRRSTRRRFPRPHRGSTIAVLAGLKRRSSGCVEVLGLDPDLADDAWRARIGIVLQSWRDHRRWRVRELLHHMGTYYSPYSSPEVARPFSTDELLEQVGLTAEGRKRVGALSGGKRRRLDVAIGLIGNPELLFLDEPTVGFDPVARRDFRQMILRLSREWHTSIILTTHDLVEAEELSESIAILVNGTIVRRGSTGAVSSSMVGSDRVSFRVADELHQHDIDPQQTVEFVRQVLNRHEADLTDLEVHRPTLEDAYLKLIGGMPGEANSK